MKIKVPGDIKLYVFKKRLKRILLTLVLILLALIIIEYYGDSIPKEEISKAILLRLVPIVLILYFTGVPLKMIDSSWIGEITDIKTNRYVKKSRHYTAVVGADSMLNSFVFIYVLTLTIRLEDGREIVWRVYSNKSPYGYDENVFYSSYAVGMRVLHISGTEFLQILKNPQTENLPDGDIDELGCVICGESNPKGSEKCHKCKHSLKITEAENEA